MASFLIQIIAGIVYGIDTADRPSSVTAPFSCDMARREQADIIEFTSCDRGNPEPWSFGLWVVKQDGNSTDGSIIVIDGRRCGQKGDRDEVNSFFALAGRSMMACFTIEIVELQGPTHDYKWDYASRSDETSNAREDWQEYTDVVMFLLNQWTGNSNLKVHVLGGREGSCKTWYALKNNELQDTEPTWTQKAPKSFNAVGRNIEQRGRSVCVHNLTIKMTRGAAMNKFVEGIGKMQ